ncbi:Ubiquitin carboxyl-terminal hydrolase 30 [Mactra antiquata]
MFDRNTYIIAGTASGIAALVYIIWGPSSRPKKKGLCRGLENLGNTCFMNVVLQAWAGTPSVVSWLKDFVSRDEDQASNKQCLAKPLLRTLQVINDNEDDCGDVHSPADIIGTLRSKRWIISHDQQDAHELFNVFTSTLDEESTKFPRILPLFDLPVLESADIKYQPPYTALSKSGCLLPILPSRESDNPFRMLFASQLECVDCKYRHPVKYDLSDSLSLTFPRTAWSNIKLDALLQRFITPEMVTDVECPGCKKIQIQRLNSLSKTMNNQSDPVVIDCNPKSSCLKRLTIGKLPQCLCLHMQRTQWLDSGLPLKKYEIVIFPEILHMDDYVYTKCEKSGQNGLLGGKALFGISSHGLFLRPSSPATSHQQQQQQASVQADINHNSPKSQEYTYKLTAVVTHLGDVFSGHFVTYRRFPSRKAGEKYSSRWLCTSDHAVKEVSFEEVMSTEAYMLFYERL